MLGQIHPQALASRPNSPSGIALPSLERTLPYSGSPAIPLGLEVFFEPGPNLAKCGLNGPGHLARRPQVGGHQIQSLTDGRQGYAGQLLLKFGRRSGYLGGATVRARHNYLLYRYFGFNVRRPERRFIRIHSVGLPPISHLTTRLDTAVVRRFAINQSIHELQGLGINQWPDCSYGSHCVGAVDSLQKRKKHVQLTPVETVVNKHGTSQWYEGSP